MSLKYVDVHIHSKAREESSMRTIAIFVLATAHAIAQTLLAIFAAFYLAMDIGSS